MKKYRGTMIGLAAMLICTVLLIVVVVLNKKNKEANDSGVSSGMVSSDEKSYTAYDFAMGTSLSVTVYGDMSGSKSKEAEEEGRMIFDSIKELDEEIISWRSSSSVLSKLNREGKLVITEESSAKEKLLFTILMLSKSICKSSDGALDITIRPLADAWGIESFEGKPEEFIVPNESILKEAKEKTGYEKLITSMKSASSGIADEADMIKLEGVVVDLGAVGKGYALDYIYDCIVAGKTSVDGIGDDRASVNGTAGEGYDKSIVLSVGGSILVYGNGEKEKSFKIGVRDPEGDMNDMIGVITLPSDCGKVCISTSGSYEKYIDKDCIRYHHIIDPKTMYPAESGLVSVTVVCDKDTIIPEYSGLISDALSTACFILGKEESMKLLEQYKAEAVFIDTDGNITTTEGLSDIFTENNE
ncbi:MAG: FAD:protein FMN transferase [Eubacterium sp.]|nr:FAD:protein FMN transferase [Eubacterium sp.]